MFPIPELPDRLWSPLDLLFNVYRDYFLGQSNLGVNMIPHLYLVPRLRVIRTIAALPSPSIIPSLHGKEELFILEEV
jgi:hypothetical protein